VFKSDIGYNCRILFYFPSVFTSFPVACPRLHCKVEVYGMIGECVDKCPVRYSAYIPDDGRPSMRNALLPCVCHFLKFTF